MLTLPVITSNRHGDCLTAIHEGLDVRYELMAEVADVPARSLRRHANGENGGPQWVTTARLIAAAGRLPELPSEAGRLLLEAQAFGSEWKIVPAESRIDRRMADINGDGRVNALDRIAKLARVAHKALTEVYALTHADGPRRHAETLEVARECEVCASLLREIVRIERENTNEPGGGSRPLHGSRRP
jgi:hypothetical protein